MKVGQTISHYRVISKLGEGGMGVVYVADDIHLGRRVALKTAKCKPDDYAFLNRFLREARAASKLSHQHIATIYDYGKTEDGQPYIVMELVEGQTLSELLRSGALTIPQALKIIRQVAEALAEAHRHGIVHRDIKPSNIAINERGVVKVFDFGLAKQINGNQIDPSDPEQLRELNTQTREGTIVGTPMYLSPEQALGLAVDKRSDLFSLGSVLYECIAGQPAFSGSSPNEISAKVIRDDPPPPSSVNAEVPVELDRLILKSLAKKPDNRYQCAETWIDDLRSVMEVLTRQSGRNKTRVLAKHTVRKLVIDNPKTVGISQISALFTRPRLSIASVGIAGSILVLILLGLYFTLRPKPYRPSPAAERLYKIGIDNLHEGSYVKAMESFQGAISIDDNFAMAHGGLAEAYIELDYHEQALKEALEAIALANSRSSMVSSPDWLYLQGIKANILQSFDESIRCFEQRTGLVSANVLNSALLELGRAYEKKEDFENAEKTYQRITGDAREYPLALLRLGVLAGRKQDFDKARRYFDQSQKLFEERDNKEGITEVRYERGSMLITAQSADDAAAELEQALDMAQLVTNSKYQETKILLKLSSVAKEQGKAEEAKSLAIQTTKEATENNMPSLKTQGLIQTGKAFLFNREYPEARRYFTEAVNSAEQYKGLSTGAEAQLSLGTLYVQQEENVDEGLKLIEGAVAFYQKGGHSRDWWRACYGWDGRGSNEATMKAPSRR